MPNALLQIIWPFAAVRKVLVARGSAHAVESNRALITLIAQLTVGAKKENVSIHVLARAAAANAQSSAM